MVIRQIAAVELGDFLGSLLQSIIDAQQQSSRASIEFIEAVGLETVQEGGSTVTKLRTVKLRFRKRNENGDMSEFEAEVPLLALVNAPSLAVSEATMKFSYEVVATQQVRPEADRPAWTTHSPALQIKGLIRSRPAAQESSETRSSFGVDVQVVVKQQGTPIGVERLFDLAELGIAEDQAPPQR
jgi:hypothetical protein